MIGKFFFLLLLWPPGCGIKAGEEPGAGKVDKRVEFGETLVYEPGPDGWGEISGLCLDASGNIYILDIGNFQISKYNAGGELLRKAGGKGQGPGELETPYGLLITGSGDIYVHDGVHLKRFDSGLGYVNHIYMRDFFHQILAAANGQFLGITRQYLSDTNKRQPVQGIARFLENGKIGPIIAQYPYPKKGAVLEDNRPVSVYIDHYFVPKLVLARSASGFIFAHGSRYKIHKFSGNGNAEGSIERVVRPSPIPPTERASVLKDRTLAMPKMSAKTISSAISFPETRPFFNKLLGDENGRIFVQRLGAYADREKVFRFDFFQSSGSYSCSFALRFSPDIIANGYLYYVFNGDDPEVRRVSILNWPEIIR